MNLTQGKIGSTYVVTDICLEEGITRRLEALGIFEGTRIQVMNRKKYGAVIIKVRGTRWAIGGEFAGGIHTRESKL